MPLLLQRSKVEVCAGCASLSKGMRMSGLRGKEFDVSQLELFLTQQVTCKFKLVPSASLHTLVDPFCREHCWFPCHMEWLRLIYCQLEALCLEPLSTRVPMTEAFTNRGKIFSKPRPYADSGIHDRFGSSSQPAIYHL